MSKKLFDFAIGNPPFQQESKGANDNSTPIYHNLLDAAFSISKKVEMIHPARFLFNAGRTPKAWNEKMLNDKHFKVLHYEEDATKVFANTDIKGGVAITYRDCDTIYKAIGVFTKYPELNSIRQKVWEKTTDSLCTVITNRGIYRYSDMVYKVHPEEMKKTADRRIAPSCFERMSALFTEEKPIDDKEYIQILGVNKSNRFYKWFRKDFVTDVDNLKKYKVLVPKANGSGAFGETLSNPLVVGPMVGFTETFISIGACDNEQDANATLRYVKTKFLRTLLSILKVTQNNAKPTWAYVPLQDFTSKSDIDWSKSIHEIDLQLYRKYGLSAEEVAFIETNVKEME